MATAYLGNDCVVEVADLYDKRANSGAGEYITSGTVTAQVYETDRTTAVGGVITLSYSALKDNVAGHWWWGVLEEDHAAIATEGPYTLKVSITASSDRVANIWVDFNTVRRR